MTRLPIVGWKRLIVIALLGQSVAALALAPFLMPPDYSWLSHTTSESAAQGLTGAWLARLGFLTFGLAVLWLSSAVDWGRWGAYLHSSFGLLMVAAAVFSHRPFVEGVAFDRVEDSIHSLTATMMGFAFAGGMIAVSMQRREKLSPHRILDIAAVTASVVIPLGMVTWSSYTGLLQRSLFLVAYVWYAVEALSIGNR